MNKRIVVSLLLASLLLWGLYRFTDFRRVVWYVWYSVIEPDKEELPAGLVVPVHSCLYSYKEKSSGGWKAYYYDPYHNVAISVNNYKGNSSHIFEMIANSFARNYVQVHAVSGNERFVLTLDSNMRFRHLLRKVDSVVVTVIPYYANIKPNDAYEAAMEVYVKPK